MKHAYVIRHLAFEDLGSLDEVLRHQGYAVRYLEAGVDDVLQVGRDKPDLLVVLGGPIGVYETGIYPFLHDEITVIRERLLAERPVIGICLGAQLMAAALGARVYPGHGKEIGWAEVMPANIAVQGSVLAPLFAPGIKVLHWHGDTFDVPEGAQHLAVSAMYPNQAFSLGRHALALQFHPEILGHNIERWLIGHACELATANINIPALRNETAMHAEALRRAAGAVWMAWLEGVA